MKRLPLFGFISALLALTSCGASVDNTDQTVACYDTGHGMKCVPIGELPANTTATCIDKDGVTETSQSSDSGPSPSDNDTSQSSDSPNVLLGDDDGDDDDDGDGIDSSAEDASGASDSTAKSCATGVDADGDGVSDSKDCDCVGPDAPPPGTIPPPTPGGPVIL